MTNLLFSELLIVYRNAAFVGDHTLANVHIVDEQALQMLRKCLSLEHIDDSGLSLVDGDPDNLSVGQRVSVTFSPPRKGLGRFARNLTDLLSSEGACATEPKRYYLIDEKFSYDDAAIPLEIVRYRKLLEFTGLLKKCADYVDESLSELIFLRKGKFVIPMKLSYAVLISIDIPSIDRLLSLFNDDTHSKQKLTILGEAVHSQIELTSTHKRLGTLISELPDLTTKFNDGYKLFVADFSYDKVRSQFEATKVEYAAKIHKVFSDIQSQLLTVPVATVLVATQMKVVIDENTRTVNTALIVGSWIFAALFFLLCFNQFKTLEVLEAEILRQNKIINEQYKTIASLFQDIYKPLLKRITQQKCFLLLVVLLILFGLGSAHWFYGKLDQSSTSNQTTVKRPVT